MSGLVLGSIWNNIGDGITVIGSSETVIWQNLIHDNNSDGIELSQSFRTIIVDNQLYSNTSKGITYGVNASTLSILAGNLIHSNLDVGIDVRKSADATTMINNWIYNNGNDGLRVDGSLDIVFIGGALGYDQAGNAAATLRSTSIFSMEKKTRP